MAESPAETIRRAVALMRERAQAATAEAWPTIPWATEECEHGCACIVYQGEYKPWQEAQVPLIQYVCDTESQEHADHIASWHPLVALAVADWLDTAAGALPGSVLVHALRIARAYLGEAAG